MTRVHGHLNVLLHSFPYSIRSAASCTVMVSCHKTNNHIEMLFEWNYHEGSELFICIAVTLNEGETNQPSKENKASIKAMTS